MQKNWRPIFKYIFTLSLAVCLVLGMPISKANADGDKKAIILILDQISLEDMLNSDIPNINMLLENGAIGLMNTRAKSSISNRGSTYLSLGMGTRTLASTKGGLAFSRDEMFPLPDYISGNSLISEYITASDLYKSYTGKATPEGEIINIAIGDIEKTATDVTPNNQIGLLGKIAKENNLSIGIVGNSDYDTSAREATMLAMDENGVIPFGYIDSNLLIADTNVLGGIRLNSDKLLKEVERILPNVDILFIDYGDTVRVQKNDRLATELAVKKQTTKAIERADLFLGEVMEKVNLKDALFMVISPNPSKEMTNEGNFALTPIIMSGSNTEKGLLTSKTTRREGLVTNFDFVPTILNFFNAVETKSFIGEPMEAVHSEESTHTLLNNQAQFLYIRKYRKVFHWIFIILVGICLIGFYLPQFTKWKGFSNKFLNYLSLTIMATPLTMMTVSLFGYKFIILDIIYVFGIAFVIAYILNKIFSQNLMAMSILGLATSIFIMVDIYFIKKLMIISPLGSDAIAGGRFYGIGNDYMGILLGSTLLGLFSLFQLYKIKKPTMTISILFYMFLVIIALSPFFGANMGGTLSAAIVVLLAILIISDKKFSFKKIVIMMVGVIIGIIVLAGLDALFNPNPTHAGKALMSLTTGGLSKLFEIIGTKLKQVFWNLFHASWNIILFMQIILMILLYKYKSEALAKIRKDYTNLFKGFIIILLGGIVVFLFNDTGTIAAALMLIYLFIPLGVLINDIQLN